MSEKQKEEEKKVAGETNKNLETKESTEPQAKKIKKVRVVCEGTLGTKLLKKGDVTDDPEYVALLETERGRTLVEEVK